MAEPHHGNEQDEDRVGGVADSGLSVMSDGEWLVSNRAVLDRGEARWLRRLGQFEMSRGYEADGFGRVVDWLVAKLQMCRASAFEKVRLARQLRLRPVLAEAFESGRISYTAARAIARLEDPEPDVDEAFVNLAADHSHQDIERAVRYYSNHRDQERSLPEAVTRSAGVTTRRRADGLSEVRAVCTDVEADEINALLAMFIQAPADSPDQMDRSAEQSTAVDSESVENTSETGDAALDEFRQRIEIEQKARQTTARQRLQGLLEALRTAGNHVRGTALVGADRYMAHIVVVDDPESSRSSASLTDGTFVAPAEAARICCDCSVVEDHYSPEGELLWLGRKTRNWSMAQRRAARVRDGGCRFPGCGMAVSDLHHMAWWERGGRTDINNALSLCEHHHTVVHDNDIEIQGDPSGPTTFVYGGVEVGVTEPIVRNLAMSSQSLQPVGADRSSQLVGAAQ